MSGTTAFVASQSRERTLNRQATGFIGQPVSAQDNRNRAALVASAGVNNLNPSGSKDGSFRKDGDTEFFAGRAGGSSEKKASRKYRFGFFSSKVQPEGMDESDHGGELALKKKGDVGHVRDTATYSSKTVRAWYIIDPRHSRLMQCWDLTTMLALLFTAIVTPVEVSFFLPPNSGWEALFLINRFVDVIFIIDLILQFFVMYPTTTYMEGARWVFDQREIVWHYLTFWFPIDLLVILVSAFDFVALAANVAAEELRSGVNCGADCAADIAASESNIDLIRKLKVLRVLRILRLIKLLRLLRMSRIFKRWEARVAINYAAAALFKCLGSVLFVAHLFACAWTLQSDLFYDHRHQTWLGFFGLCWDKRDSIEAEGGKWDMFAINNNETWVEYGESVCEGPFVLYTASLYWAVMTVTSIGYGDLHPTTTSEQLVATVVMLLGSVLWGQVIATFCGVVSTFNPEAAEFRRTMDDLNRFMRINNLAREMRTRLREYFHQTKHLRLTMAHRQLITQMSPMLQAEVAWRINERWLRRVWFLRHAEQAFIIQVALLLSPMVFAPGELAASGWLYIVHRGIALYGGKILTAGKVWGEDMILAESTLRRKWCARAMNYLEAYLLSREDLIATAESFPETYKSIRRAALLLALRRHLISAARVELARAALEGRSPPKPQPSSPVTAPTSPIKGGRLPSLTKRNTKKDLIKQKTQSIAEASSSLNTSKLDSALFQASETEGSIAQKAAIKQQQSQNKLVNIDGEAERSRSGRQSREDMMGSPTDTAVSPTDGNGLPSFLVQGGSADGDSTPSGRPLGPLPALSPGAGVGQIGGAEKLDELREKMSNLANVVEARAQVTAQGVGDLKAEVRAMKAQIDALAAALLPK